MLEESPRLQYFFIMKKILFSFSLLSLSLSPLIAHADLKSGYESFVKKDYVSAASSLRQASIAKNSPLRDYYLWALGSALYETGKENEAIPLLEELINHETQSIFAPAAYGPLALALQRKGENEKVKKWVPENLSKMNDAGKGEATYAQALAGQASGEKDLALKHFREVAVQYPFVDEAELALSALQAAGLSLSPEEQAIRGDRFLKNKNYASAVQAFNAAGPSADTLAKGKALYFLKRYSEAAVVLSTNSQKEALYYLGLSYDKSGQDSLAKQTFLELHQRYPGTVEASEGLATVIKMELSAGRIAEAQSRAQILYQSYAGGNYRDRGLWAVAWNAYERKDWQNAKLFFEELSKGKTDLPTQARGLYWLARTYQNQGDNAQAQNYFKQASTRAPFSYYSFMALKKLKNSNEISEVPEVPNEWKKNATPSLQGASGGEKEAAWNYHWNKAEALYRADMGKYSNQELAAALDQNANQPANLFKILEASKKTEAYFLPVWLAQRYWDKVKDIFATTAEAEDYRNTFQFPFAYRSEVTRRAKEFSLSPYFVVGLMRQESAFQPWIVSSANAQGLMQMLPATARGRAKAAGISMGDLFDPEKNIELGSAELSFLLNRFGGNWVDAIAGYNAGPGRPPQWRAQFGGLAPDEYIEEIPFSETTLYVRLVLRNYWSYATLYR